MRRHYQSEYGHIMTLAAAGSPAQDGVWRGFVSNTIFITTGGLLLIAPAVGGFILASGIIAAVVLTSVPTTLPADNVTNVRANLIILACIVGLATFILCCFLTRLHRSRVNALMATSIPKPQPPRRGFKRLVTLSISGYGLRALAYQLIGLLWGPVMIAGVLGCLVGGPAAIIFVLQFSAGLVEFNIIFAVAAAALTLSSPWILHGMAKLDLGLVRWVNGMTEKAVLAQRVQQVTEARSGVVAAADAERRRIERNLHDGAQQRLTALSVTLGVERSRHSLATADNQPVDSQRVTSTLEYAQEEVQNALQEIRHLVRGLHPAVLEDRGLDAAISGIASRSSLPISVDVDVPERPSIDVESVAYFVVSEAVNNIIAHAHATRAAITVQYHQDTLYISVDDDGVGGAAEHRGTGLIGLRQRVESIDGSLQIRSQPTKGTTIEVELPCEL